MVMSRMRDYELVMVLTPDASEDQATAIVERVASFIAENGGAVSEQENWGVRRLAYPIRRFQEGNYMLTRFAMDARDILELDRTLKASEDVLRHLLTKVDKKAKKSSE